MMALGAEMQDCPAEQAPLHPRLHEQGQIAHRLCLEGGDRSTDLTVAAELLGEQQPRTRSAGQCLGRLEHPLAVLVHGDAVNRREQWLLQRLPHLVADPGPPAVEESAQRLDNVVYRLGLGASRKQARQLVTHRHFEVNGKTVNIPSYSLKPGDVLRVKPANGVIDVALEASKVRPVPSWLSFNGEDKTAKILARPERHEMESGVEEQLIVEFYSR